MQQLRLLHGGDYNPEQWLDRPDILAQDIELMKKAHVNTVTLGVGVIVITIVLTWIYVRRANTEFDATNEAIIKEAQK